MSCPFRARSGFRFLACPGLHPGLVCGAPSGHAVCFPSLVPRVAPWAGMWCPFRARLLFRFLAYPGLHPGLVCGAPSGHGLIFAFGSQGCALGWYVVPLQGTVCFPSLVPRAAPWAGMWCPFRARSDFRFWYPGLHPGLVCGAPSGHGQLSASGSQGCALGLNVVQLHATGVVHGWLIR